MLQVIKTAGESDITNGLLGIAQQSFCLVQANTQQVLVGDTPSTALKIRLK